jgi:hypothetical protein
MVIAVTIERVNVRQALIHVKVVYAKVVRMGVRHPNRTTIDSAVTMQRRTAIRILVSMPMLVTWHIDTTEIVNVGMARGTVACFRARM